MLCRLRADVEARDVQSRSAIFLAVFKGSRQITELLLDALADPCRSDRNGQTAIGWAAEPTAYWDRPSRQPELLSLLCRHVQRHCDKLLPMSLDAAQLAGEEKEREAACELSLQTLSTLKQRARMRGVEIAKIEALDYAEDPKKMAANLILGTKDASDKVHDLVNCYIAVAKVPVEIVWAVFDHWSARY